MEKPIEELKSFPRLIRSTDICERLKIESERLDMLARCGYAPCYYVDGNGPFFRKEEITQWARENILVISKANPVPKELIVLNDCPKADNCNFPASLKPIQKYLRKLPMFYIPPCVYFLIDAKEVVYVGQTTNLYLRVHAHRNDGKKFTNVFFIPIEESELLQVEKLFITYFKPKYNGTVDVRNEFNADCLASIQQFFYDWLE